MPTVLFVCTANICRSPAAQVLFAHWLEQQGTPGQWQVLSAGTWAEPGAPASAYSRELAAERGLSLDDHRSQRVDEALMDSADVIVCMTRSHREALQVEFPQHAERVVLLTALAGHPYDVADPYGGPRRGYEEMYNELWTLIQAAGPRLVALASQNAAA